MGTVRYRMCCLPKSTVLLKQVPKEESRRMSSSVHGPHVHLALQSATPSQPLRCCVAFFSRNRPLVPHRRSPRWELLLHVKRRALKPMHAPIHGEIIPHHRKKHHPARYDRRIVHRGYVWIRGRRETENDEHEEHEGNGDRGDRGTLPQDDVSVPPPTTYELRAKLTNTPSENGPGLKSFSNTNLDTMGVIYSTYVAVTEIVNTALIAARPNKASNPIRSASPQSNQTVLIGVPVYMFTR